MLYEIINQSELTTTDLIINLNRTDIIKSFFYDYFKDGVKINATNGQTSSSTIDSFTISNLTPYSEYKIYFKDVKPAGYQIKPITITTTPGIQNVWAYVYQATIYGYKRDKNNSDPDARITYTNDAVGKTPAAWNFPNKEMNYGSWNTFCTEICQPVMLKKNGVVGEQLSSEDQTKLTDTTTNSSISNVDYDGNAMVEFHSHFKWIKRWEDSTYEYVNIANAPVDPDYHAYAYTNALGKVKDEFYLGMFQGNNDSSILRSIAGQAIYTSAVAANYVAFAQANGTGWDIMSYQQYQYIRDLLVLICKTDNLQYALGTGRNANSSGSKVTPGGLKAFGMFRTNAATAATQNQQVKAFYMEDFWANCCQLVHGLCLKDNVWYYKNTPPYNLAGEGYETTGIEFSLTGTTTAWMSAGKMVKDLGLVPIYNPSLKGSATTYYCDSLIHNYAATSAPCVVHMGGFYNGAGYPGPFSYSFNRVYTTTLGSGDSARLSYIDPT